jgi:hypothetical protein
MTGFASRLTPRALVGLICLSACSCAPSAGSGSSPGPSQDAAMTPQGGRGGTAGRGGSGIAGTGGGGAAGTGGGGAAGSGGAGGSSGSPADAPAAADGPGGPSDGGSPAPDVGTGPDTAIPPGGDPFGVRRIYPSKAGGREWYLPADAERGDGEWGPGSAVTRTGEASVFHLEGSPRIAVSSPAGKPWWRNVEITAYYRLRATLPNADIAPEYQLYARGERHVTSMVAGDSVNQSRPAPPGTPTWPNYPFTGMINGHCLGSSYKGYLYATGRMDFKKEISHTGGYTGARDGKQLTNPVPVNGWIGFKVVIRNFNANQAVHMESWIDERADGNWRKVNEVRDTGGWAGGSSALDGCTAAPFNYQPDQIVTWAGPYVNFRFDFLSTDFKWFSAREIDPLP